MNIRELFEKTPRDEWGRIKQEDARVSIITPEGIEEYLIDARGELILVSSTQDLQAKIATIKADLAAIKTRLGVK